MRKIIDGALYNTETAREVGSWDNRLGCSDFRSCAETLYQTRGGKYFLCGVSGPAGAYSKPSGSNSWTGGENIIPLSLEEVKTWAEKKLDVDEYIKEFGKPDEAKAD